MSDNNTQSQTAEGVFPLYKPMEIREIENETGLKFDELPHSNQVFIKKLLDLMFERSQSNREEASEDAKRKSRIESNDRMHRAIQSAVMYPDAGVDYLHNLENYKDYLSNHLKVADRELEYGPGRCDAPALVRYILFYQTVHRLLRAESRIKDLEAKVRMLS